MGAILYKDKVYGAGGSIIEGYYKSADGKFYEESTYETEIPSAEDLLYIDLTSKMQFIFDGTNFVNITEDAKPTVTEASSRTNIASGDTLKTIIGKIKKFFSDLKAVAFTGAYSDLSNKPTKLSDFTDDVVSGNYLPLSGGTVDGYLHVKRYNTTTPFSVDGTSTSAYMAFRNADGTALHGSIGVHNDKLPYINSSNGTKRIALLEEVKDGTLTIKRNNASVGTFTANQSSASDINIECATPSDVEGSKTATGSIVTVTDAADIYAEEVDVAVVATQTGSGTPSPSNIRPIQGYDIVSVDRCGKNLFGGLDFAKKLNSLANSSTINTSNKTVTYNRYNSSDNIVLFDKLKPNTTYTLILTGNVNSANTTNNSIALRNNEGGLYGFTFNSTTKTRKKITLDNVKDLILTWANGAMATVYYDECGLFEGEVTVEQFEEYLHQRISLQLGQTVYGGQLTLNDDGSAVFVGTHGYKDCGDLTWTSDRVSGKGQFRADLTNSVYNESRATLICSSYETTKSMHYTALKNNTICISNAQSMPFLRIRDDRYVNTSASDFKTAIKGVQVVYELYNPFTIHLSAEQLKLLQGTNNVWSNAGNVTLKYQPDNVIAQPKGEVQQLYGKSVIQKDELYQKGSANTNPDTITLAKPCTNYDLLIVRIIIINSGAPTYTVDCTFNTDELLTKCIFCNASSGSTRFVAYIVTDSMTLTKSSESQNCFLKTIWGVKFTL